MVRPLRCEKDGFKASLMTRTSDTVRTHLQRCRTLGEGLLKLCAHQSPYTGRTHRLFPPPQAASVRPRFEPTATPPSRTTSRGCLSVSACVPECVFTCKSACVRERVRVLVRAFSCSCMRVFVLEFECACERARVCVAVCERA